MYKPAHLTMLDGRSKGQETLGIGAGESNAWRLDDSGLAGEPAMEIFCSPAFVPV